MIVENLQALPYIFTGDIYITQQEKELPEIAAVEKTEDIKPVAFNYAGNYQKKILILASYTEHETMEPTHLGALESTIKRKELVLADVAILNVNNYRGVSFEAITTFFNPLKLLILGEGALPAGLTPPPVNQLIKLSDCTTLHTFSFAEMMGNRENTKAFWEQMKNL